MPSRYHRESSRSVRPTSTDGGINYSPRLAEVERSAQPRISDAIKAFPKIDEPQERPKQRLPHAGAALNCATVDARTRRHTEPPGRPRACGKVLIIRRALPGSRLPP